MRLPLLTLTLLAGGAALAACTADVGASRPADIRSPTLAHLPVLRGDYFPLASVATGRTYHIYVRLPEGYNAARRYPVVYVLDGDSLFPLVAASHLFIALDDGLPEAIVVGIAYGSFDPTINKRTIDFRLPDVGGSNEEAGAPAFAHFLRDELLPQVEKRYSIDPAKRILFGQSFSASFVLYSAFTDPDLFWGRIASNPSFKYGRALMTGQPRPATRQDLKVVVASGTANNAKGRADALAWLSTWETRSDAPWRVQSVTIQGGTHAANAGEAYRGGLRLLFEKR